MLQFDEHTNDAGAMTRCEAYLDSKGFLRWWAREDQSATATGEGEPRWTPRPHQEAATARPPRRRPRRRWRAMPKPAAAHERRHQPDRQRRRRHQGPHPVAAPHALRRLAHAGRAFHSIGLDARVTPDEDARTLELGGKYTSGDECYPQRIVLGDYMKLLEDDEARPQEDRLPPPHRQRPLPLRPVRRAAAPHPRRPGLRRRHHPLAHLGRRLRRHRRPGRRAHPHRPGGRWWSRTSCSSCCS